MTRIFTALLWLFAVLAAKANAQHLNFWKWLQGEWELTRCAFDPAKPSVPCSAEHLPVATLHVPSVSSGGPLSTPLVGSFKIDDTHTSLLCKVEASDRSGRMGTVSMGSTLDTLSPLFSFLFVTLPTESGGHTAVSQGVWQGFQHGVSYTHLQSFDQVPEAEELESEEAMYQLVTVSLDSFVFTVWPGNSQDGQAVVWRAHRTSSESGADQGSSSPWRQYMTYGAVGAMFVINIAVKRYFGVDRAPAAS